MTTSSRVSAVLGGTRAERWRGLAGFVLLLGGVVGVTGIAGRALPAFDPEPTVRSLSVEGLGSSESVEDARIRLPFYRPESLGAGPVFAALVQTERPRFVAFWRSERWMTLSTEAGGAAVGGSTVSAGASPSASDDVSCGETLQDGVRARICTDLGPQDLRRLLRSLRAVRDRR